jgi:hypothetical protein
VNLARTLSTSAAAALMVTGLGCNADHGIRRASDLDDLAFDTRAKNIAVIVGAPNDLPGIDYDVDMMKRALAAEGRGFEVRTVWKPSAAELVKQTAAAAADVGDGGTLFFFFSGHGAESGHLMAQPGFVNFDDVTAGIKKARSKPLKRFVAMIDSCFSGQMVDGQMAVARGDGQAAGTFSLQEDSAQEAAALEQLGGGVADATMTSLVGKNAESSSYAGQMAEQILVVAAANRVTTSLAGTRGSTFTKSVYEALRSLETKPSATIREFLAVTKEKTRSASGGHHTPVYRVFPAESVLNDRLTGSDATTVDPSQTDPVVTPDVDADLFLALKDAGADGSSPLVVSAKTGLKRMSICAGTKTECTSASATLVAFDPSSLTISGRGVFDSRAALSIEANKTYTLIGISEDDKVISARSFQFQAK